MTAGDVENARWCCELATYALGLRRNNFVKPAQVCVESLTFPVPEGFDYDDFLAAVNEELRRYKTNLHASACRCPDGDDAVRKVRITGM
jgi:hypothetical protein